MTKLTLSDVSNLLDTTTSKTTINTNSAAIETAFENTLSRDGTSPNTMSADLDMNGQNILNVAAPSDPTDLARLQDILDAAEAMGVNAEIITGAGDISLSTQVTGVLPVANGGTGTATYVMGDVLGSNSANTLSRIPGNTSTTRKYLMSQGTGTIASPVVFQQVNGNDIAGNPLTKTDDTNVTLTLGGSATTALLNAASLTLGWTGTLGVSRGGTGFGSYTTGDLIVASGAAALTKLSDVATGNVLISGGVGTAPSYGKVTNSHVSGTTGSGNFVLATSPVLVTPALGTPSSGTLTSCTGLPVSTGISGLGTNVATALAVNVGSAGAFVTFNGALGSPSSVGTLPAYTLGGTISGGGNQINNVIIGTSTPLAGSFTTLATSGKYTASGGTAHAVIRPAQITSNQNNYAPAGLATCGILEIQSDAARDITGFSATGMTDGQIIRINNVGGFTITLKNLNAGSTGTNQIVGPGGADISLTSLSATRLYYSTNIWRAI